MHVLYVYIRVACRLTYVSRGQYVAEDAVSANMEDEGV
jgi:hypothetical protein